MIGVPVLGILLALLRFDDDDEKNLIHLIKTAYELWRTAHENQN
jgi:hypothetical protein